MSIQIQSATYGIPGHTIDVGERVQLMALAMSGSVVISNETMGHDPAVGHVKQLKVTYTRSYGKSLDVEGREGSTIFLVDEPRAAAHWPV